MKVRSAMLLVLILALCSGPAFAQTNVTGGVKGGVGFATISSDDPELEDLLSDSRTGFLIGGFVDMPVNDVFSVGIEGLFTQKGAEGSFTEQGVTATFKAKVDYIEVPILAKASFGPQGGARPFVYGGVAPAFKTSAKMVTEFLGQSNEEELDEDIKSTDFGLVFGGGVRVGMFAIEARYNLGLVDVNNTTDEGSIKTRQFSVLASVGF